MHAPAYPLRFAPVPHARLWGGDRIARRYGRKSVYFGGAHEALAAAPLRIAFQHIPDLEVEGD